MNLQIIEPQSSLWVETLKRVRHDVYHFPAYVELEARRLESIPEAILIEEGENLFFLPYLLRSCNYLFPQSATPPDLLDAISPYGYPGFLLNESAANTPGFLDLCLDRLIDTFGDRGICSAFLRLHPILNENIQFVCSPAIYVEQGKTVSVDLTLSKPEIWAHTRKGHQSSINKCKRIGFTARMVPYTEYLEAFLEIYGETMDRTHAQEQYYFDRSYFDGLSRLGEVVHLCIVELNGKIVAASILFESCGIVQAHLGGSRTEFLGQSPFMELLDYVRLWGKDRGNQYFHIGGGIGGKKDNLYTFKSGFSRQRHPFNTMHLVTNPSTYKNLVESRAEVLKTQPDTLIQSGFFPAYRATI